jgi:hypothetical protein
MYEGKKIGISDLPHEKPKTPPPDPKHEIAGLEGSGVAGKPLPPPAEQNPKSEKWDG